MPKGNDYSKHPFSGAMLVSGKVSHRTDSPIMLQIYVIFHFLSSNQPCTSRNRHDLWFLQVFFAGPLARWLYQLIKIKLFMTYKTHFAACKKNLFQFHPKARGQYMTLTQTSCTFFSQKFPQNLP